MSTTDHAAAFMEAVKGIPVHFVTRALRDFTTGTDWTRSPKTWIAARYAEAKAGKSSYEAHRFALLTDLNKLRERALELQETTRRYRQDLEDAHARSVAEAQAARLAREATLTDAARWRKLWDEVDQGRVQIVVVNQADGCSEGELITDAGELVDHIDTIQPTPTERTV